MKSTIKNIQKLINTNYHVFLSMGYYGGKHIQAINRMYKFPVINDENIQYPYLILNINYVIIHNDTLICNNCQ